MDNELGRKIDFLLEIDKLKTINRRSVLVDGSRYENSAEHSWHVAMCATVLADYASDAVDMVRVIQLLLVHDIVEIDAGDTFAYDAVGKMDQRERELAASPRIFGLLPCKQAIDLSALWEEFDAQATAESKFANAVDRFMPLLHNYYSEGSSWRKHGVGHDQVLVRMAPIQEAAPALWPYVLQLLNDAVEKGYLLP